MSKRYHIYGLGNALVDYEIETTSEELAALGIEKGVMTLIDEDKQQRLMTAFHGKHHARACGGSAANTIIGAQSLGSECFYSCRVGNDEAGRFYRDDLIAHGVDTNLQLGELEPGVTGKCLVLVSEDAERSMNTFLGVTGELYPRQLNLEALKNSEWLYIEGYLASSPSALDTAVQAMQVAENNGVKRAFSLSDPNMVKFCAEGLSRIIGRGVDLLFCNREEALGFAQCDNLDEAIGVLKQWTKTLVVTLGAEGALIVDFDNAQPIRIEGFKVAAVDTNGAGDLFAGSFLHGLNNGLSLDKAGQLAAFASAQLVTEFGPRLKDEKLANVKNFAAKLGA